MNSPLIASGLIVIVSSVILLSLILTGKIKIGGSKITQHDLNNHPQTGFQRVNIPTDNTPQSCGANRAKDSNGNDSYIDPKIFSTGIIQNTPQPLSSNCTDVMYPINLPNVHYGVSNVENPSCKCTEFIQAP